MSFMLVTGANGFVGRALCDEAASQGFRVRGATRTACHLAGAAENVIVGACDNETDWMPALGGIDAVIHLAARVHVMHDESSDPLAEFRKVNVAGAENLARQAARAGVKRLVYVSSIKVNGEGTPAITTLTPTLKGSEQNVFSESDLPAPQDPYGISKWEAEQALHRVAAETGLEVVIVRPPLVYGAGVKGNFAQMLKVLARGIPLPLAAVDNRRSLIYVGNLVDALILCATHSAAAGQTYLVSDGEDVSTPELLRQLGAVMGHPARLYPCPQALLRLAGRLTGKADQIERLLGSLQIDSDKIRCELGWQPPYTLDQGLRATADGFCGSHS
ncbi:MAG: SDR family oxidoreductase [Gallionella sp.]|nr:SDR family oxidoreductase [Gallionella sp.]